MSRIEGDAVRTGRDAEPPTRSAEGGHPATGADVEGAALPARSPSEPAEEGPPTSRTGLDAAPPSGGAGRAETDYAPATIARSAPSVPRRMRRVFCLDDLEPAARRHLPVPIFGYVAGIAETGASRRLARGAFEDLAFVPRVLAAPGPRRQGRRLLGHSYDLPFGVAPMGLSALAAHDGDVALARAARAAGTLAVMSATSLTPLERVARGAGSRWFQAYFPGDEGRVAAMIDRVAAAGYETLVITLDVPVNGNREADRRNGFATPLRPTPRLAWQGITRPAWLLGTFARTLATRGMPRFDNLDAGRGPPILARDVVRSFGEREKLAWHHVEAARARWPGPLVLKGILSPLDAARARDLGADGVIVSNHGARQLDGAIAPLAALPAVRAAAGDMAVMLDGEVRRGTDVLKALALGADFVFVGRPLLYAAALAGEAGVRHAVGLLAAEIDRDMAFVGLPDLDHVSPDILAPAGVPLPPKPGEAP